MKQSRFGEQHQHPRGDRLDIFCWFKPFEAKNYPLPELDPIEAIKYEMEERGLKTIGILQPRDLE
jgi:antitoxin component HigA of HigAB toxin-antitoxin module